MTHTLHNDTEQTPEMERKGLGGWGWGWGVWGEGVAGIRPCYRHADTMEARSAFTSNQARPQTQQRGGVVPFVL